MIFRPFQDPRQRAIVAFVAKALGLYIAWFISYDYFIAPAGKVDTYLNYRVASDAGTVLDLMGWEGSTQPGNRQTVVCIGREPMVGVGNPCNGLELFVLFAGFILCFPGSWRSKGWFIPAGSLIIHAVNVLRTASLAWIQWKHPAYLDFNHHYTFTVLVYSVIFLLWIFWTNRYSDLQGLTTTTTNAQEQ